MSKTWRIIIVAELLIKVVALMTLGKKHAASNQIYSTFIYLGGVYVKFLQLLAIQPGFFEQADMLKRLELYDQVAAESIDVNAVLHDQLGSKIHNITNIEPTPFATGSFAQVYRAQLRSGEDVVLKILRPSVTKFLRLDQLTIKALCILLDIFAPGIGNIKLHNIYKEFKHVTTTETDYIKEAQTTSYFHSVYSNHDSIVVPKVFIGLCSNLVIVQQYIEGEALTKLLAMHSKGVNVFERSKQRFNTDLVSTLSKLAFELIHEPIQNRSTHGDPHPGNLLLMKNGQMAIIDFGIIGNPPVNRQAFFELIHEYDNFYKTGFNPKQFFKKSLQFYSPDLFKSLGYYDLAINYNGDSTIDKMATHAENVFNSKKDEPIVKSYLKNAELRSIFIHAINPNNQYQIDLQLDGGVLLKASSTFMSILSQLGCKNIVMSKAYSRVLDSVEDVGIPPQAMSQKSPEQSLEIVSSWFNAMARKDPLLVGSMLNKLEVQIEPN